MTEVIEQHRTELERHAERDCATAEIAKVLLEIDKEVTQG